MVEISDRVKRLAARGGWMGVDLDGTAFTYNDWVAWNVFGDPIGPMIERIQAWLVAAIPVRIVTARVGLPIMIVKDGILTGPFVNEACTGECRVTGMPFSDKMMIEAIHYHLIKYDLPRLPVQCFKDLQMIEQWDDRAVQVIANTGRTLAEEHVAELAALRGKQFAG